MLTTCNLLHSHQDLVNTSDVLLNLSDVMLEHCKLNTFSRSQSLSDSRILILDVFVDNSLNSLNLVEAMVKSDNLSNKLSSLGHKTSVNALVNSIKPVLKRFINRTNSMKLGVMRAHNCTVVTDKLFATVTEIPQRLFVQNTVLLAVHGAMTAQSETGTTSNSDALSECVTTLNGVEGLSKRNVVDVSSSKNIRVLLLSLIFDAALFEFILNFNLTGRGIELFLGLV